MRSPRTSLERALGRHPALTCLALALALAACHKSKNKDDDDEELNAARNLRLAISSYASFQGAGPLWAMVVSELGQGAADLNGDGDDDDDVLFVFHDGDAAPHGLGLAVAELPGVSVPRLAVGDARVAFGVSEFRQGATDLNGDGDALDTVLHVYDDADGSITNTGLAVSTLPFALGGGHVAFAVSEAGQGATDLDGDGTTSGAVLHVFDSLTRLTTNARRAVTYSLTFHDHAFAYTTDEPSAGADLNGDGDATDQRIFELFDLGLNDIVSVPLAILGTPLAAGADDWLVLVDEAQQGVDLDGDGDREDGVFHRVQPQLGTRESLGLAALGTSASVTDGTQVALAVQELDGFDRNGDGDLADTIAVLYDAASGRTFDSGLALATSVWPEFLGDSLLLSVSEHGQGLDLDGDGDLFDRVLHVMERASGRLTNTGIPQSAPLSGARIFGRMEQEEACDFNGDGDEFDEIAFTLDPATLEARSSALAGAFVPFTKDPATLVLFVDEGQQCEDRNGDGDGNDLVFALYDLATGTSTNLRLAGDGPIASLNADGRGLLLANEYAQGRDLNGDGDVGDQVLYALDAR